MTKRWAIFALLLGTVLRLIWASDMEWKQDEIWMFEKALSVARGEQPLPQLGMMSGAGMVNPGFSIWPFVFFAHWSPTPLGMLRWVQGLNVLALWGFLFFISRAVPQKTRSVWWGGLSLFAVSALPVLFARKLWAQDILPIFCLGIFVGHFYRKNFWGAFAWGLLAPLAGQVHMSGFFLSLGLLLLTLIDHFRRRTLREVSWLGWISGGLVALIPLWPWLCAMAKAERGSGGGFNWNEIFTFKFFTQWFANAWGVNLKYSAKSFFMSDFVRGPLIGGVPTWGIGALHLFLLLTGLGLVGRWLFRKQALTSDPLLRFHLIQAGLVVGALYQLSGLSVHAHYLIILSPFLQMWAAALLAPHPRLFKAVFVAQALITVAFLWMVHQQGGLPLGSDYGRAFWTQQYSVPPPQL